MWPGIRLPLMIREGSVPGAIEPGLRCRVLPWVSGPPPKWWRCTTPWKPRPLVTPLTLTRSPAAKIATVPASPALGGSPARAKLSSTRGAVSRPARLTCPAMAFGVRFALRAPKPGCTRVSVTCTTGHGPASMTVTGTWAPSSPKTRVMPSFLPISPFMPRLYSTLISTSTPAGRSSFVSASTVWDRESRMSMSRLCVFSSNCSRLFLSMCGLRSTVHSCRLVGSGMGPETCAPVFSAVRTMSAAAWSISAWSNALRRMRIFPAIRCLDSSLLLDFGGDPGAHRAAALADREAEPFLHRDRRDQLDRHLGVVARHPPPPSRRQLDRPRYVRRAEVELRPVPLEERRMAAALFLGQHIHFGVERRMRRDAPRLCEHHPPLDLVLFHPAQQQADVVPRLPLVQQLAEHLDPRHHGLLVRPEPYHLHFLAHFDLAALDPPRRHRASPGDREHVFHRHQERLVHLALRNRDALVEGGEELPHLGDPLFVALDRLERRTADHGDIVAGELVLRQQLPNLQLHQVQQLRVVHQIALVQEHHDGGHVHLARQ